MCVSALEKYKYLPLHHDGGSGDWFYCQNHWWLIRYWSRQKQEKQSELTLSSHILVFNVFYSTFIFVSITSNNSGSHVYFVSSPSCRVVTDSVSMLKTLSPMSLVASIRSLYEVKGFSLQTEDRHFNMYTQTRVSPLCSVKVLLITEQQRSSVIWKILPLEPLTISPVSTDTLSGTNRTCSFSHSCKWWEDDSKLRGMICPFFFFFLQFHQLNTNHS